LKQDRNFLIIANWCWESGELQKTEMFDEAKLHSCALVADMLKNTEFLFCFCFVSLV
jgi:hypothetical protein